MLTLPFRTGMTVSSRNSRNGKISTKTHKNTPEVSQFYSFYRMNVKLRVFLGFIIDGILFPIQSFITRLNSQRLPVTQYRLHSRVSTNRRPKTEDRRPKTEDRRPKTEDRRPKTEDRRPKTEDRRSKTEDRRPKTEKC